MDSLELFKYSFKKKDKFNALIKVLPSLKGLDCLDIGCGNGVISYNLRKLGGEWFSVDSDDECVVNTLKLVGDNVLKVNGSNTCFDDDSFDLVIALDVIEHIKADEVFIKEVFRILKPKGIFIVTTPRISKFLVLNYLKELVGLTPDKYGHVINGYSVKSLSFKLVNNGFLVVHKSFYSKFFTELVELVLNSYYFFKHRKKSSGYNAFVSPSSDKDLEFMDKTFKVYKLFYPFLKMFSWLDHIWFFNGYGLLLKGIKKKKKT